MPRNPNGDIPGFEGEFYGTVGNEKRHHKTHFAGVDQKFKESADWEYEWIEVGRGKYRLQKKAQRRGDEPEVEE